MEVEKQWRKWQQLQVTSGGTGGAGGKWYSYIKYAQASYSGTTTGSPTVLTSGSDIRLLFKSSGSYTG